MEVSCSFDIPVLGWALKISDMWLVIVRGMVPRLC